MFGSGNIEFTAVTPSPGGAGFINSLTTIGTGGVATVVAGVLNIPNYTSPFQSLTVVGSSGPATLIAGVLNVPNYGAQIPTWNDTLSQNQTALQQYISLQQGGINPFYYMQAIPDNFDPTKGQMSFLAWMIDVDYNPGFRHNLVGSPWSYNYSAGGSLIQAGEGAFAWKTETDFFGNFEFHWPEIITSSGVISRLWSFYGSKSTGSFEVQANLSQISVWDPSDVTHTDQQYFTVQSQHGAPLGGKAIIALQPNIAFGQDNTELRLYQDFVSYVSVQNPGGGSGMVLNAFGNLSINGLAVFGPTEWLFNQGDTFGDGSVRFFGKQTGGPGSRVFDLFDGNGVQLFSQTTSSLNLFFPIAFITDPPNYGEIFMASARMQITYGITTPDVQTADPGSGVAQWQVGTKIAAAVAFDATHYVETKINGVVVKLAVVT